jgi:anti-anti-sigma factor
VTTLLGVHAMQEPSGFRLVGELDASTALKVDTAVRAMDGSHSITLDLSKLVFLDSSGIRVFLELARDATDGQPLVLLGPTGAVLRLLRIAGLDKGAPGLRVIVAVEDPSGLRGPLSTAN